MAWVSRDQDRALTRHALDPIEQFKAAVSAASPWDSIVDFATHPSFCGKRLYPRQRTLLRLIYLEVDQMTQYDMDVIEQWRQGFTDKSSPCGVQPDIWQRIQFLRENGYRRFPHILACLGRRASKGMLGGVLGAETLAYMWSLDDWQAHYGLDPGVDGELTVVATSQSQAARRQFADIRRSVESCKYLRPAIASNKGTELTIRTPADVRRIADLRASGVPIDREIASLRALAVSSSSAAGRGGSGFANFYDEFAHVLSGSGSVKSSEEIYEAYQPSLDQFGKDSLTYIPSSPYSMTGKFYDLFKQGAVVLGPGEEFSRAAPDDVDEDDMVADAQADPEMLVVQVPSWELYRDWERSPVIPVHKPAQGVKEKPGPRFKRPIQWPPDGDRPENLRMRLLERRNPEKFGVERRAKFANVMNAYLDPDMVDAMFKEPGWRPPLARQDRGYLTRVYRMHCDPSKSGANFACAIGHLEDAPPDEHGEVWPHVIIDYMHVWKPEDFPTDDAGKHRIDYVLIERRLEEVLGRFPSTKRVTFDQWNCQAGGTLVPTSHGLLRLDEIVGATPPGSAVGLDLGVQSHHCVGSAREGYHKGVAPTRRITTKLGNVVEATPEHRLWVRKAKDRAWHADNPWGFAEARDVEVGDWLCVRRNTALPAEEFDLTGLADWDPAHYRRKSGEAWTPTCDENLGEALGLLVAEGDYGTSPRRDAHRGSWRLCSGLLWSGTCSCRIRRPRATFPRTEHFARFGNSDDEVLERYRSLMEKSFGGTWRAQVTDEWMGKYHFGWVRKTGRVPRLLHALGLTGTAAGKVVPWVIRRSPAPVVKAFLRGYFEGDGGVCFGRGNEVWLEATTTSEEIARTVQQLLLAVGVFSTVWEGTYRYKGESRRQWRVKMYGQDLLDFADAVGFAGSRKQGELATAVSTILANPGRGIGLRSKNTRHGDEQWVRVTRVEESEADCYDLSVPGPETYVANGVVSHNSAGMISHLQRRFSPGIIIAEETATAESNRRRAERFKSALNLGWVSCYRDDLGEDGASLIEQELKFLTEKNGRVDRQQFGPVTTKDLADCYDDQTEVLTEHGWKMFADVLDGERVATLSSAGQLEYQEPTDRVARFYEGPMLACAEGKFDFRVTPGHRLLGVDRHSGARVFVTAKDLLARRAALTVPRTARVVGREPGIQEFPRRTPPPKSGCSRREWTSEQDDYLRGNYAVAPMGDLCAVLGRSRSAVYNRAKTLGATRGQIGERTRGLGTLLPPTKRVDLARFVGFWLAEGRKLRGAPGNRVEVFQKKAEGVLWADAVFSRLGWPVRRTESDKCVVWAVRSRELKDYMRGFEGIGHELLIPDEVFAAWTAEEMEALLEGLLVGDGTWHGQNGDFSAFSTTSRRLADDVQRLALHVGLGARVRRQYPAGTARNGFRANHDLWQVCLDRSSHSRLHPSRMAVEDYSGMVYCLTVPNSTLLVRRNGVAMWCGNCVMTISADLLHNALDRWNQRFIGATAFGSTDVAGMRAGRELERAAMSLGSSDPRSGQSARAVLAQMRQDRSRGLNARVGQGYSRPTRGRSTARVPGR